MKIIATVNRIETNGEHLTIQADGWDDADPLGTTSRRFSFSVRDTKRNQRALYIGRDITITIATERTR